MNKQIFTSFLAVVLFLFTAQAQVRSVSGTVKDNQGGAVPNATVKVKGSSTATSADANGNYKINASENDVLVFSAVGYGSAELRVGQNNVLNVSLTKSATELENVVVTALGIRRRPKEMGYANTKVRADQLVIGRSPGLAQALAGKVAGLTIFNTSASVTPNTRIVLRGNRSITGDNTALIVLDGVSVPANTINYLNPNDIEDVTVLKGGQAATLFGPEGVNGALVITTKRGGGKPRVTFSNSTNFEDVAYLPKFQTSHGSGSGYGYSAEENFRPFENQQYGDAYDGQLRSPGRILEDGSYQEYPYRFIPGIRRYGLWQKGVTSQTDVSYSGGDENSKFFLSFQDANVKGIVYKDGVRRDALRFNASKKYGKFTGSFDGTFTTDNVNRTNADFYFYALNTPGWIPIDQLRDWKNNPFANPNGYFNDYYNNPWFELDNNRNNSRSNVFNGNVNLNFKPLPWLEVNYRLGSAITNSFSKSWTNRFDYSNYAKGILATKPTTKDLRYNDYSYVWRAKNSPITGGVSDAASYGWRLNSDLIITFNKDFGDFSTKLILGNSVQDRKSKSVSVGSTSVIIPGVFNVSNRAGELLGGESNTQQRRVGNYADLTLGYKDVVFIHGSGRTDQSSIFYAPGRDSKQYNFTYYGADLSFIVTEAIPSLTSRTLNFLKLRGGFNKNGNENLGPYNLLPTFSPGSGFPYGSNVGVTVDNTFPDPKLSPEFVYSYEGGFEASFWDNRINFDVSYYYQDVKNQVFNVAISSSTGYTSTLLNAGQVANSGFEMELKANVFKTQDWDLSVTGNYTYNTNKVKKLFGGLDQLQLNNSGSNSYIFAALNQPFPLLKTTYFAIDSSTGKTVIDPGDGWPVRGDGLKVQGTTIPKHQLGLGFKLTYKWITLMANAEYRGGFKVYHQLGETMSFTGSSAATTRYNRQPFIWPNSAYWDGSKYVSNDNLAVNTYIAAYEGWGDYGFSRGVIYNGDWFTSNGAFWKLRDIALSFNVPNNWMSGVKAIKGVTFSLFGRNLITLLPKDNIYTDPEFSNTTGNGVGINGTGNTPPVRQYGASLSVTF